MEETLRVHKFDELPSQADFESQIESRNVPAIFNGCIKGWEAMSKWNPRNGGLNYLQEGVGNAVVVAMLSRSAPVFYGDLTGPEMVPLPFSTFITSCKQRLTNSKDDCGACVESENHGVMGHTADESCLASHHQVYLAQNIEKIGKQGNGQDHMLGRASVDIRKSGEHFHRQAAYGQAGQDECRLDKKCGTKDLLGTNQKQKIMMHQLDPHAVQALHKLVTLVHDNVDSGAQSKPLQYTLTDGSADHVRGDCRKITRLNSFCWKMIQSLRSFAPLNQMNFRMCCWPWCIISQEQWRL